MEWFIENFSRVKFYEKTLWNKYLAVFGVVSSVVTLISFFVTAKDFAINMAFFVAIFFLLLIGIFLIMWWKANHLKAINLRINNTKVQIAEGDIWDLFHRPPEERNDQISVIGVNDFYDIVNLKPLH